MNKRGIETRTLMNASEFIITAVVFLALIGFAYKVTHDNSFVMLYYAVDFSTLLSAVEHSSMDIQATYDIGDKYKDTTVFRVNTEKNPIFDENKKPIPNVITVFEKSKGENSGIKRAYYRNPIKNEIVSILNVPPKGNIYLESNDNEVIVDLNDAVLKPNLICQPNKKYIIKNVVIYADFVSFESYDLFDSYKMYSSYVNDFSNKFGAKVYYRNYEKMNLKDDEFLIKFYNSNVAQNAFIIYLNPNAPENLTNLVCNTVSNIQKEMQLDNYNILFDESLPVNSIGIVLPIRDHQDVSIRPSNKVYLYREQFTKLILDGLKNG